MKSLHNSRFMMIFCLKWKCIQENSKNLIKSKLMSQIIFYSSSQIEIVILSNVSSESVRSMVFSPHSWRVFSGFWCVHHAFRWNLKNACWLKINYMIFIKRWTTHKRIWRFGIQSIDKFDLHYCYWHITLEISAIWF